MKTIELPYHIHNQTKSKLKSIRYKLHILTLIFSQHCVANVHAVREEERNVKRQIKKKNT